MTSSLRQTHSGALYRVTSIGSRSFQSLKTFQLLEVMILPELWRKASQVVPDSSPHVVQRGVRRIGTSLTAQEGWLAEG